MGFNPQLPIFAKRYQFIDAGPDWDRGRSGFTNLVEDTKGATKGVIKRADITSKNAVTGLENETKALEDLKGMGVPKILDKGQIVYDTKEYKFLVIEYIDGVRVEKELSSLSSLERAEILTQFLGVLRQAHSKGIVNGDVDIKHLFWRKEKPKLVVIDWGNAILNINKNRPTEFAYDLARTAEIIYSLLVGKIPPATGPIALPDDSKIVPGLAPLPVEFRKICEWAPRTPTTGAKAPYSAAELFEIAARWMKAINDKKPYRPRTNWPLKLLLAGAGMLATLVAGVLYAQSTIELNITTTPTSTETSSLIITETITQAISSSPTDAIITLTPEITPGPTRSPTNIQAVTPLPRKYSTLVSFDKQYTGGNCWTDMLNGTTALSPREAFTRRGDGNWSFGLEKNRALDETIQSDFSQCVDLQQVSAISMNVWVSQIDVQREFGIYLEDVSGNRREYTIWLDRVADNDRMILRIREDAEISDYELLFTENLKFFNGFPRLYYQFPILVFLEIDNNGLDILYLKEGPLQAAVTPEDINPNQMIRADNAVRITLGEIKSIGLIGYGGEIETLIWPLVLLESK
jgi:serine/threonine protein kinase